jgi:hypothetical protein
VQNAGFDSQAWIADKDRGGGPRAPRWDAADSTGCPSSGAMAVSDRTALSAPFQIGPPGTMYFYGFRQKLPKADLAPGCEAWFCTDATCTFVIRGGPINALADTREWQAVNFFLTVPTPDPASTPIPYARIACHGYEELEPGGPEVFYDRVYFSQMPIAF